LLEMWHFLNSWTIDSLEMLFHVTMTHSRKRPRGGFWHSQWGSVPGSQPEASWSTGLTHCHSLACRPLSPAPAAARPGPLGWSPCQCSCIPWSSSQNQWHGPGSHSG
jgi:hypothetical protein